MKSEMFVLWVRGGKGADPRSVEGSLVLSSFKSRFCLYGKMLLLGILLVRCVFMDPWCYNL